MEHDKSSNDTNCGDIIESSFQLLFSLSCVIVESQLESMLERLCVWRSSQHSYNMSCVIPWPSASSNSGRSAPSSRALHGAVRPRGAIWEVALGSG